MRKASNGWRLDCGLSAPGCVLHLHSFEQKTSPEKKRKANANCDSTLSVHSVPVDKIITIINNIKCAISHIDRQKWIYNTYSQYKPRFGSHSQRTRNLFCSQPIYFYFIVMWKQTRDKMGKGKIEEKQKNERAGGTAPCVF